MQERKTTTPREPHPISLRDMPKAHHARQSHARYLEHVSFRRARQFHRLATDAHADKPGIDSITK